MRSRFSKRRSDRRNSLESSSEPFRRYRRGVSPDELILVSLVMTTDQSILVALAIIVGLAVGCQLIAPALKIPALVLLLPAGFIAGNLLPTMNPTEVFGDAFSPLVNIAVGLILFHGGLELVEERVDRPDNRIIRRLVILGALITWACASGAINALLDLPSVALAVLLGAIVIVSGPTVIGPLLAFAKPQLRIRRILAWEGTLIDPIGALIAVVVFQYVQAEATGSGGASGRVLAGSEGFLTSIAVGITGGFCGLALIWVGMRLAGSVKILGTQVLLGAVVVTTALTDAVRTDSGLVAAIIMGMFTPVVARERVTAVKPFFDTVVSFAIGVLFISISALVTYPQVGEILLPSLGVVAVLVLVIRPASVLLLTVGTTLTFRERLYIGCIAPRGIVAAATASSFSVSLLASNVPGAEKLLPITFVILAGTVMIYSAIAVPMSTLLKVRDVQEERDPAGLPPVPLP